MGPSYSNLLRNIKLKDMILIFLKMQKVLQLSMIKTGIKFKYVIGDVQNLPYPQNTFDTVSSLGVIEHFLNPDKVMKEMYRVLKTNGHLILMTPNKYSFGILDKKIKILLKVWNWLSNGI